MASTDVKTYFVGDSRSLQRSLSAVTKQTQQTTKSASAMSTAFEKVKGAAALVGLAVTGRAVGQFLADSVRAASDLSETQSKVGVLFGESAAAIESFASTAASSLGQTKQQAMDAAATFAVFGKSAGLAGQDLVEFSTDLTALATDMASFSNTSPQEAIEAIGAALRGESEPIRRYGVLLDDATLRNRALEMGLISTTKNALTPQQKALAAQVEIMRQTTTAQGDFARTSDGLANSQRILAAQVGDLQARIGAALLPAVLALVTTLSQLLTVFESIPGPVRNTALAFGATVLALKLLTPALATARMGLATLILDFRTAPAKMAPFRAALGGTMAMLGGPWGVAILAGITALTFFASRSKDATAKVEEMTGALQFQNGTLDENSRKTFALGLARDGLFERTRALGLSEEEVTRAIVDGGSARDDLLARIDAEIAANTTLTAARGASTKAVNEEGRAAGLLREEIVALTGGVDAERDASRQAAAAVGELTDETSEVAGETKEAAGAFDQFTSSIQATKKAMDDYMGVQLGTEEAHRAAETAVDALRKAFKDNGKSLDINTTKGRANREAIQSLVEAANDEAAADRARGKSIKQVNKNYDDRIDAIYREAEAAGISREAVDRYLQKIGLTPEKKSTRFETPGLEKVIRDVKTSLELGKAWSIGLAEGIASRGSVPLAAAAGVINKIKAQSQALLEVRSPSRWARWLGEMVNEGFAQGLKAGNIADRVAGFLEDAKARLRGLVQASRDYASTVSNNVRQAGALTLDDSGKTTYANVLANLRGSLQQVRQFRRLVKKLTKAGASRYLIQQVLDYGPGPGSELAKAMLAGGPDGIATLNETQRQINRAANAVGASQARDRYGDRLADARSDLRTVEKIEIHLHGASTMAKREFAEAVREALKDGRNRGKS